VGILLVGTAVFARLIKSRLPCYPRLPRRGTRLASSVLVGRLSNGQSDKFMTQDASGNYFSVVSDFQNDLLSAKSVGPGCYCESAGYHFLKMMAAHMLHLDITL
jgi:hypothetical protein